MFRPLRQFSWMQHLFAGAIGLNIALILAGPLVVPGALGSPDGLGSMLGDVGMQLALAALALAGPFSFGRYPRSIGISGALGLVFAVLYVGSILLEFRGIQTDVSIVALFLVVAFVAGAAASYHTRRWFEGVVAANWTLLNGQRG